LKKSKFISIEGNPELSAIATSVCRKLGANQVICKTGSFEAHLEPSLNELKQVDLMFFDGNHQYKPTWQYFTSALPYTTENSVFIFDDIYWSKEMKDVWQQIKNHPQVTVTIDLYKFGLVFFKRGQRKQHFKLRV
jgi:predicted O-methyltransferase YrrM